MENKPWWQKTFNSDYSKTYVDHLSPELTDRQVDFLIRILELKPGDKILDLGCGEGRHSLQLSRKGMIVVGIDFSEDFINKANSSVTESDSGISFIKQDMRNIAYSCYFDVVINIFTSFGYFDDPEDDIRVVRKIRDALKVGGQFIIDLNNYDNVLARFSLQSQSYAVSTHFSESQITLSNGIVVTTKENLDTNSKVWSVKRTWEESGVEKSYSSSIRLYSLAEIQKIITENGMLIEHVWGSFKGTQFDTHSGRMIIKGKKL